MPASRRDLPQRLTPNPGSKPTATWANGRGPPGGHAVHGEHSALQDKPMGSYVSRDDAVRNHFVEGYRKAGLPD